MQSSFRWYGPSDRVSLAWLRQMTPRPAVVTHLSEFAPGEVWSLDALRTLRVKLNAHGLRLGPVESVFWTDAMKLGRPERDQDIASLIATLRNLRAVFRDIPELIVTYNLMPLDWGRTDLARLHPNGARSLAYDHAALRELDLSEGLFLPGWGRRYDAAEFTALQDAYTMLGEEGCWASVKYVLDALVPAAAELDIRLAAHPNDPPWSYLGLPCLLGDAAGLRKLLALHPHRSNALCFCTGSLGADPANDVSAMVAEFIESIAWIHLRSVKTVGEKSFVEADHADPEANTDLLEIVRVLAESGWTGHYRSDHGLDLLMETDVGTNGYPAIDRYVANKLLWGYWRALTETPARPRIDKMTDLSA